MDFEQYESSTLADTLKSYIQDLPCLLIPAVVYSELVYTAQGKLSSGAQHKTFKHHLFMSKIIQLLLSEEFEIRW